MASEFLGRPFQGPPSVPHASEEFFKVYFIGAHVRILAASRCARSVAESPVVLPRSLTAVLHVAPLTLACWASV